MKKIFIILLLVISIYGCGKKDVPKTPTENERPEHQIDPSYLSKEEMNSILFNYATTIYNDTSYTSIEKINGEYFISLNDLKNKFNYDISKFVNYKTKKECDKDKTGIYIDVDNVRNVEYKDYPIMIALFCD